MPKRVTDFRVDIVDIPTGEWNHLPAKVKELFRVYGTHKEGHGDFVRFELPIYRWEEINRAMGQAREQADGQ